MSDVNQAAKREMEKDSEDVLVKKVENFAYDKMITRKGLYSSGGFVCYVREQGGSSLSNWKKTTNPQWDILLDYKLILKEHSLIAGAVSFNPYIAIVWHPIDGKKIYEDGNEFFDNYDSDVMYRLKGTDDEDGFAVTEVDSSSDGGSNTFYSFPEWVVDVDSLCRYWKLSSAEGNILKSLTAKLGSRHGGTDEKREVKKCLHYAVERMLWNGFDFDDIQAQVEKHIKDKK